jgi:glycosyltransferase involved in cell wall biosynthesis
LSHTFKLAEFLALGKAIISTPISRELPEPLCHGEHVHYVDGSVDALREAITKIAGDREYRTHLEQNAHDYYIRHLRPKIVVERLLDHCHHGTTHAGRSRRAG